MEQDQQRDPRLSRAVDVTIQSWRGHWPGKTIDLSPSGAKVTAVPKSVALPLGTVVQLRVALPDGDSPLSLPARVMETSSDGVSVSFFNLKDQQARRLRDLLDSFLQQERQGVLHPPLDSDRSLTSKGDVPAHSSLPPEFVEDTRPAERGGKPKAARGEQPEAAEALQDGEAAERPVSLTDIQSDQARLKALLSQAGLDSLHLPANGVLSAQWRNFLEQLGPNASGSSTGGRSSRSKGQGSDPPTLQVGS